MKKKLQIRFVLLSMTALIILQTAIDFFCIYRNYQQMAIRADKIISQINKGNTEQEGDVRYFLVTFEPDTYDFKVDLAHTSLIKEKKAVQYAQSVMNNKQTKGFIGNYRYQINNNDDNIRIIFLSRNINMETFKSNSKTLILISILGLTISGIVLSLLSGFIVTPIVISRQKQKEFITSASHELKTPLTVISADVQLLQCEICDNEWINDIQKQVKYLTEMTQSLVMLSRIEEEKENIKLDFPFSDIAEDILTSYIGIAKSSDKAFEYEIEKNITYNGDEKAIRQLIAILLDNAFKYCPKGGKVKMSANKNSKGVDLTVINSAENIDKTQLNKFVSRFYRGKTAGNVKGFGLGLSIADAIVKNHKGKILITATDSSNICITVLLK